MSRHSINTAALTNVGGAVGGRIQASNAWIALSSTASSGNAFSFVPPAYRHLASGGIALANTGSGDMFGVQGPSLFSFQPVMFPEVPSAAHQHGTEYPLSALL